MTILPPEVPDFKRDVLPLTGDLRFPLTYDYMFTALFQHNTYALKGFLAAKLNISPDGITGLEVMNPMEAGSSIDDKDIVLDVKVCLNNKTIIDIEMQVTPKAFPGVKITVTSLQLYISPSWTAIYFQRVTPAIRKTFSASII